MTTINVEVFADHFANAAQAWDNYDKTSLPPTGISEVNNLASLVGIAIGISKYPFLVGAGFQVNTLAIATGTNQLVEQIAAEQYEDAMSTAAAIVANIATVVSYAYPPARAVSIAWTAFSLLLDPNRNAAVQDFIADLFNNAQRWFRPIRRDPLTFDLDGDGIETVPTTAGVLFDHDGDGLKQGTGWIGSDDGFLVLDRNGNGTIDNGSELFGDVTPLYAGGLAADGFAALAQEDTNADGVVSSLDANWNNLRIWRDLDQDGISDEGELFTLDSLNIASINVASIAHSQTLANGNQIADLGTYTRTDGSVGSAGVVADLADVNLAVDTFQRQFTELKGFNGRYFFSLPEQTQAGLSANDECFERVA